MFADLALIAVATEAMVGYPDAVYRLVGHPVTWIGRLIAWCDEAWNSQTLSFDARRRRGVCHASSAAGRRHRCRASRSPPSSRISFLRSLALLLVGVLASSLLAQRSLDAHVADVATALEQDGIEAGRQAVAQIVGRDTQDLDEAAVCRAAIESLAENFSDGVVAPLFWMVFAGLPGALAYKAINTADSMIGHKSPRHLRLRLGVGALRRSGEPAGVATLGAVAGAGGRRCSACRRGSALATVRRDAGYHRSPNAGWPEAAMAGALGIRLSGPRIYRRRGGRGALGGRGKQRAWRARHPAQRWRLYRTACGLQIAVLAVIALGLRL